MFDYALCGWHLRSDTPLPLLATLNAPLFTPDIHVTHAAIPAIDQPVLFSSPFLTLYSNGKAVIRISGRLSILVSTGQQIIIEAGDETTPGEIMTFLLGPALGLICHQRRALPLHGASVRIGDVAITLIGQSGAGKSTTATALIKRGHQLLCDDISVIDPLRTEVQPSFPSIKLWQDAADALTIQTNNLSKARTGLQKFHYPANSDFNNLPTRLQNIIILTSRKYIASAELLPLDKISALAQLRTHIYRQRLARLLGAEQTYFKQLGQLISKVPVMVLNRPDDISQLDSTIELIEHVAAS
jgi:ABC-type dipeptide/oligopeptide/nickel transport system ATPase subunit